VAKKYLRPPGYGPDNIAIQSDNAQNYFEILLYLRGSLCTSYTNQRL